ncbi:hypothetical protein Q5P01_026207 [Channa striata]|uniref:Uncharacterized protein n=1 Tax=Channa striata TaxID=64152 RepID=A0AA88IZI4_CHASR|nr:hypothetical protein Q5P01_026207 [Channa striata]
MVELPTLTPLLMTPPNILRQGGRRAGVGGHRFVHCILGSRGDSLFVEEEQGPSGLRSPIEAIPLKTFHTQGTGELRVAEQ